jgi:hypothetical protein
MRNLEKKENLDGVEVVLNNCKEIIEKVKEELVEELKMLENE